MRPLLTASLLALTLGAAACAERSEPAPEPKAVAPRGDILTLAATPVDDLKPVAATVTTRDMAEARARIGGTLSALLVREGDYVQKGQVIAQVSDQRLNLETTGYDAQAAAAAAEAARAEADLARVQTLYDKGFYAKARLDQATAAARAAQGQADAARARRAASAELGAQGVILAPSSGRILTAPAPAGSVVAAGQSVATLTSGQPLLRLEIPEGQARSLHVGDRLPVAADELPGLAATGTVIQIFPAITAGQVTADLAVDGLRADLVGQRVGVKVKIGERQALVVPARYVARRFGLDFVRLVAADRSVTEIAVQTAPAAQSGMVEILSGAQPGDRLAPSLAEAAR
ncbi:efflux RND transporter periplasmic adaptor subunit [Phenylobacterium sp.]|uniref:efflux RND transporter periplasmic adaptor subunit n=1 Tax=Phenylobacterium sp. TaxID=1871053 RepID=UPI002731C3A2|nr:efflux RND transporter periplasmic adaptor subunit [Phenylobacterium sp.]MDP1619100.1 efflux RND transporter periplasmic adaptor subunit [Phenylobacterium sp.]MDP1986189.1 efflux RND transporter periplasmic adaptor subunit [Phenylobacterium sp.]